MNAKLLSRLSKFFVVAFIVVLVAAAFAPPVQAQSSCGSTYVVQSGDWMSKIARNCGVTYSALLAANPQITTPWLIYPGQVLNIPGGSQPGNASLTLTPNSGIPGTTVTVTGAGWGANSIVRVGPALLNNDIVSEQQVTANANGVISASVQIPNNAVIGDKWVVKGFIPGVGTSATSNQFTVTSFGSVDEDLFISPTSGPAGTTVTVTGAKWPANSVVRLGPARPNGDVVSEIQVTANASGAFTTQVTIPSNAANGETWVVKAFIPGAGFEEVSNNFTVGSGSSSGNTYVVQRGDTLNIIARRFGVTYTQLLAANPQISNPNLIYVGQRINLPGGASTNPVQHTVARGESLKIIAAAYNTTWDAIYALNRNTIANPNIIYVGQVIRVR